MKEGAWINIRSGKFAWVSEHSKDAKNTEFANAIGIPEHVQQKIAEIPYNFQPGPRRDEIVRAVCDAGFIRMRGHRSYWTFEYTRPGESTLWAIYQFLAEHAGPFTTVRVNDLRDDQGREMSFQDFEREMKDDPANVMKVAVKFNPHRTGGQAVDIALQNSES